MTLVMLSLALLWAWEALRAVAFFAIHPRVAAFIVAALGYGGTYLPPRVLLALGAAGAVGLLRHFLQIKSMPPVDIPRPRRISPPPSARGKAPAPQGVGHRIPKL